jgi:uncharacterized RDD family membrane protein YckC
LAARVALDSTVEAETPEHVRFRYRVAGPVRRALAYVVDLLVRGGILLVAWLAFSLLGGSMQGFTQGAILIVLFMLEWAYFLVTEMLDGGRSPGKRVLRLRVVKEGGFPLTFNDSALRNLLRGADFLPVGYLLGLVTMGGDDRFRRLGDRVAGTLVVIDETVRVAAPLVLERPPTVEELEGLPHRFPLSAWERETLEMFLRRADLTEARRDELAGIVALPLAQRVGRAFKDPVRFLELVHHRATGGSAPAAGTPRER